MSAKRFTVERTFGSIQCECPEQLCTHPNGLRDVSEYVVVDNDSPGATYQTSPIDRYRDALGYAKRLNRMVELGVDPGMLQ